MYRDGHLPETKKKMDLLDQKEQIPFFFILNTYFYHYFLRERNLNSKNLYSTSCYYFSNRLR